MKGVARRQIPAWLDQAQRPRHVANKGVARSEARLHEGSVKTEIIYNVIKTIPTMYHRGRAMHCT